MRRLVLLLGVLPVLLGAQFPSAIYNHTTKNATCTSVPSDCGVGSEATCSAAGQPCLYTATKMNNVADEVEAIETALCTNMSCVLKPTDIDTSAELAAIVGDETGSGALAFGTGPTLSGPVIAVSTVAGLPAAGSRVGAVYAVTDSTGTCVTGGGSLLIWCRDNGSSYDAFAAGAATGAIYQTCFVREPLTDSDTEVEWFIAPYALRLVAATCNCDGACTAPIGALSFGKRAGGNAFTAISLTGGGTLSCNTGNTANSYTTFDTTDSDRTFSTGEGLRFSTSAPTSLDRVIGCVTFLRL